MVLPTKSTQYMQMDRPKAHIALDVKSMALVACKIYTLQGCVNKGIARHLDNLSVLTCKIYTLYM